MCVCVCVGGMGSGVWGEGEGVVKGLFTSDSYNVHVHTSLCLSKYKKCSMKIEHHDFDLQYILYTRWFIHVHVLCHLKTNSYGSAVGI